MIVLNQGDPNKVGAHVFFLSIAVPFLNSPTYLTNHLLLRGDVGPETSGAECMKAG